MSSCTAAPDSMRTCNLRNAMRRITSPFRKSNYHDMSIASQCPRSVSPEVPARESEQLSVDPLGDSLPTTHSNPLLATPNSDNSVFTTSDSTWGDYSYLDPSLPGYRGSCSGKFTSGEWTLDRATAHNRLARRLMSKYGVDIHLADNTALNQPTVVHRVQKAPRMKIHRACHHCGIEFNQRKRCTTCGHEMCKRCPRSKGRKTAAAAAAAAAALNAERRGPYQDQSVNTNLPPSDKQCQYRDGSAATFPVVIRGPQRATDVPMS